MTEADQFNCSECLKKIVRGYFVGPGEEAAFYCDSCSRSFCKSCGFFDEHDDLFHCNQCWLIKAKGLISNENFLQAMWIFKKMGRSRDIEEMKNCEIERRKRLKEDGSIFEEKRSGFIKKDD